LEFARDDAQAMAEIDWSSVVERSVRLAGAELEACGVRLDVATKERCLVRGDAQRLQQVVLNLILNAVQAMPQGGNLRISLSGGGGGTSGDGSGAARLLIDDTGTGFPRQGRERLFEPFVTTRANGSGLGLAVAKRIVEEHGGQILLGDAPGGGARVEVRLPAV
jgi:signal transduction histidine kinase